MNDMNDAAAESTEETEATPPTPEGDQNDSPEPAEAAPEAPRAPVQVEEVDRLRAENLNLKLIGCVNRETILQQQLNELGKERQSLNELMQVMQVEVEQKYNINLRSHHILPDSGMVVPRNPAGGMDPRVMAMLQKQMQQKG